MATGQLWLTKYIIINRFVLKIHKMPFKYRFSLGFLFKLSPPGDGQPEKEPKLAEKKDISWR